MLLALAALLLQTPGIPDIQIAQTGCNEPIVAQLDCAAERGSSAPLPAVHAVFPSGSNLCQEEPFLTGTGAHAGPTKIAEMSDPEPVFPAAVPGQAKALETNGAPSGDAREFTTVHSVNRLPPAFAGKGSPFRMRAESLPSKRLWYGLVVAQHSAATFDAWTTRRVIQQGRGREVNPLMRPFAHSGALYAAVQVAPALLDYLGKRMMTSHKPWVRRLWWVPQVAGTGASLWSGVHNLRVAR